MGRAYTDEEKENIRIKIKQYGKEMFEKEGFKNFRIQKLTKKVGISLGGFYTFFANKEALYEGIIEDEKNRIRLKISNCIENDNITPKDFFVNLASKLPEKVKENKLYENQEKGPYNLMSELIFDIDADNRKENLVFLQNLRKLWDIQGNKLKLSDEEILGILSILGAISMKQSTMDKNIFEKLYKDISMYLINKIV
ncbi:TetR/AcrR family transcriptional regulator [Clostridium tyrobutyricum]|uniref:TetR/AcrR family transcriptional regulator n=1 Tax=Clostridium tyrobutyricum TaxID=1519 RepID=UPI00057D8C8F|nr:TetR/AcrR family transcriptional regulator [Clostridium tyrobutyricum]